MTSLLPYLLIVSVFTGTLDNFLPQAGALNASPYDGAAVPLTSPYDTGKRSYADFSGKMVAIRAASGKEIWPLVYLNRIVGHVRGGPGENEYFKKIKGMDINDRAGALSDFYSILAVALKVSREAGSPGIVIDLEPYNDPGLYSLWSLWTRLLMPRENIKERLLMIGEEMEGVVKREYPDATVLFFFTGLGLEEGKRISVSYIAEGMLRRAQREGIPTKFISGGEWGLGYCHESVEALKKTEDKRGRDFAPLTARYKNLRLGGTLAPWNDPAKRSGYFMKGACASSRFTDMASFEPVLEELKKSYGFVWLYGGAGNAYNPFDAESAQPFNTHIKKVFKR